MSVRKYSLLTIFMYIIAFFCAHLCANEPSQHEYHHSDLSFRRCFYDFFYTLGKRTN